MNEHFWNIVSADLRENGKSQDFTIRTAIHGNGSGDIEIWLLNKDVCLNELRWTVNIVTQEFTEHERGLFRDPQEMKR